MTKFIKTDYDGCRYITAGKWYEVTRDGGGYVEFISDIGIETYTEIKGGFHLHGRDFEIQEAKTLQELDVKEGDVVECVKRGDDMYIYPHNVIQTINNKGEWCGMCPSKTNGLFILISRASETPKLWRDMTDAERGALLLAKYDGKVIEYLTSLGWSEWVIEFVDNFAYRIKPTPKVETVGITYGDHHITFNTIDGEPDCASITMERL